jgi:hypothetical protein
VLTFSFFASARDNQPKPLESTWEDLAGSLREPRVAACTPETCKRAECPEKHGHAWSPASYPENAPRSRSSVTSVSVLVLDIDHVSSDDQLADILDKIPYQRIIHGSHSDKPGDRCVRVVVRLDKPVPGEQWPQFWNSAIKLLDIPVDQSTKDASRLYFLPSRPQGATETTYGDGTDYLYASTDGPALDVGMVLALDPGATAPSPTTHVGVTPTFTTPSTEGTPRDQALDALAHAWPTQGRHQASLALTGALAHAKWDQDQITDFVADLMQRIYPDGDPNPRKREDQARDSVAKVARGEPVSGWPSLIPHVGDLTVAQVTKSLGIGGKPSWLQNILAQHAGPQKPTLDQLQANYKANRSRLLKQRTDIERQVEAKILGRILDREQPAEDGEDRTQALVNAIRTLVKYAPPLADHEQIAQLLAHVFPVNVGQDADKTWATTLHELVDSCAAVMAQEAQQDGEFEVETSGMRVGKPKNNIKNIFVALKKMKVKLRFDEFAFRKLMTRDGGEEVIIEDIHLKELWLDMELKYELTQSLERLQACLEVQAYHNSFHPVRDYLDQLEWDKTPRVDNWLHTYCQAEDTEYTRAVGRLVLVAAVRRARRPGCKFDEMLILEGGQGTGKSTALIAMCPNDNWYTNALPLGSDSKKVIEVTGGKWIVEAGELGGMNNRDIRDLKDFLSSQTDEARMSYGREVRIAKRQFIIIGTTNDAKYLRDPTGNRRFWPVLVIEINLDMLIRDRDQLWAEAAYYEALDEKIRLDPKYYALAAEEQEERRVVANVEAMLSEAFSGHVGKMRVTDVYVLLGKDPADTTPFEETQVGEAMRRLGWKHTRRRLGGALTYVYAKGNEAEQQILLSVSGRKVVRAVGAQAQASVPLTIQAPSGKVN